MLFLPRSWICSSQINFSFLEKVFAFVFLGGVSSKFIKSTTLPLAGKKKKKEVSLNHSMRRSQQLRQYFVHRCSLLGFSSGSFFFLGWCFGNVCSRCFLLLLLLLLLLLFRLRILLLVSDNSYQRR